MTNLFHTPNQFFFSWSSWPEFHRYMTYIPLSYFTYFLIESSSRVKTISTCTTQEGNHSINLSQSNVNCACLVHMARWLLARDCCRAKRSTSSFMRVQFSNKKVGLPFNSMPSWKILHLTSVFGTFIGYTMDNI